MFYREFPVPEPLRRHVRCVWQLCDAAPEPRVQTIYPDGCCELIVHLGIPMRQSDGSGRWSSQARCVFAAQQRGAVRLVAPGRVHCLGVRLQPAASSAIAGARLVALRDRIVDLAGLDAGFASAFDNAVGRFDADPDDPTLWQLLGAGVGVLRLDRRVETAVELLGSSGGSERVRDLAAVVGLGERAFQDRFLRQVGLGPKQFARIVRLQAILRLLDTADATVAAAAADSGFADQAHATREFGRFTGRTPARMLAALRDARDGDHAVRLALAFVRGRASSDMPPVAPVNQSVG